MSDPWSDEWNSMSYTERLNWWWVARRAYQSQEDFAAGKPAADGVSCKYGIPGFLPGTRTPYVKPVANPAPVEEAKAENPVEEAAAAEESKPAAVEEAIPATTDESKSTSTSDSESKPGTVNLIIPPGNSTLNISNKKNKKNKNKNRH